MKHHQAEKFDSGGYCLICPGRVLFRDSDGWNGNTCPHSIKQNEDRAEENKIRRIVSRKKTRR